MPTWTEADDDDRDVVVGKGVRSFSSTLTSLPGTATMSGRSSSFTSATVAAYAPAPAAKVCWVWKVPLPLPGRTLDRAVHIVGDDQILILVAQVCHGHGFRLIAGGISLLGLEGAVAVAQQYADVVVVSS